MILRPVFLALLTLGLAQPLLAQQPAPARDSVIGVVQHFFDAMAARDTAALAALLLPDARNRSVFWRGDSARVRTIASSAASPRLAVDTARWRERMWNPQVLQRGPLALVWTEYDFHHGDAFTHCGVDLFTLVRDERGWRIADIAYTVEPEGCAPSPLGPLR